MITPDEMKSALAKLRAEKQQIQEKINFYNLCLKEAAKANRPPPSRETRNRMCLAALIDYVENGTKPVKACEKAGLAKHRWGIGAIAIAWCKYWPDHYWHIYETEYKKDQAAGKNYTHGSYVKAFPPLITKEIRAKAKKIEP